VGGHDEVAVKNGIYIIKKGKGHIGHK